MSAASHVQFPAQVVAALKVDGAHRTDTHVRALWKWARRAPTYVARYFSLPKSTPSAAIVALCRSIHVTTVPAGTLLTRQGDLGTAFYVVLQGAVEILHHPVSASPSANAHVGAGGHPGALLSRADRVRLGARVTVVGRGKTFGGVSASGAERDCSAVATCCGGDGGKTTQVLRVGSEEYARCCPDMIARAQAMLRRRVGYLMALDLFSDWPAQELGFLARWMTELRLRRMGDVLYEAGQPAGAVCFVVSGSVGLQCAHPSDPHSILNLHHVIAPSFCGEEAVIQRLAQHSYTAVCTSPDSVVLSLPAAIFDALVADARSTAYATSAKLARTIDGRAKWYNLRKDMAGESAEVPFSFLDHSQTKVLVPEVWAPSYPRPEPARMAELFLPTRRANRRTSTTAISAVAGAARGRGAEGDASMVTVEGGSTLESIPLTNGARRPPRVSTAAHDDDGRADFARGDSSMSQNTGTTGRSSDASSPALERPRLTHQHTDMADMTATPRLDISKDGDNLWSSFNTAAADSRRILELEARHKDNVMRTTTAAELRKVMKVVGAVKRLVGNVRRRKEEAAIAGAPEPSTPVTSHLAATAPPTTAVLYQGRRHTVAGELKAEALHSGAGRAPAGAHGVQWDASMRKGRGGNHGATIASPVGKGFARNANFGRLTSIAPRLRTDAVQVDTMQQQRVALEPLATKSRDGTATPSLASLSPAHQSCGDTLVAKRARHRRRSLPNVGNTAAPRLAAHPTGRTPQPAAAPTSPAWAPVQAARGHVRRGGASRKAAPHQPGRGEVPATSPAARAARVELGDRAPPGGGPIRAHCLQPTPALPSLGTWATANACPGPTGPPTPALVGVGGSTPLGGGGVGLRAVTSELPRLACSARDTGVKWVGLPTLASPNAADRQMRNAFGAHRSATC